MRVAIVYNPRSGNFSNHLIKQIGTAFARSGHDASFHDSLTFGAEGRAASHDLVCITGGDGTVRTVVSDDSPDQADLRYCIYPAGTINLVAREAGYPSDPDQFVRMVSGRPTVRHFFAGQLDDQRFLACASVGPDSYAVANVSQVLKAYIGRLAYALSFLALLWRWPRHRLKLVIDGVSCEAEAVMILKSRYYAGPWILDRKANLEADDFRLLILGRARRRDYLRLITYALFGMRFADPCWQHMSARHVEISADVDVPIQADGDIIARTPAKVTMSAQPLNFL